MQTATGVFYLRCRGIKGRKKGGRNIARGQKLWSRSRLRLGTYRARSAVRTVVRFRPSVRLSFLKRGHAPVICDVVEAGASEISFCRRSFELRRRVK